MTWTDWHRQSEIHASEAAILSRGGRSVEADALCSKAAELEERAFSEIDPSKTRTLGVIASSAVSLWFKAGEYKRAERLAFSMLGNPALPEFAAEDLRILIQTIWTEKSKLKAGVSFMPGQVMVSVKGGDVVVGGAPLDLIVDKVQTIQSLFYRTIEFLKDMPHRLHGGPVREIQEACRPWLFQAPPGSYQFSVAIQEPPQKDFFAAPLKPDQVALHFLSIIKATTEDDTRALEVIVPDKQYRSTFLKLSRNLAPTGKTFEHMEIRAAGETKGILLSPESRFTINRTLKTERTLAEGLGLEEEITVTGTLRAVHLDKDWLDVSVDGQSVHIEGLKDTIDDLIGPMVNRAVIVRAIKSKTKAKKLQFIDIELDE